MPIETPVESIRGAISPAEPAKGDPDHHLWRNGRLWWIAFTVHLPGWQKERVRVSLHTADVVEARRRRDDLLRRYPAGARLRALAPYRRPRRAGGASQRTHASVGSGLSAAEGRGSAGGAGVSARRRARSADR